MLGSLLVVAAAFAPGVPPVEARPGRAIVELRVDTVPDAYLEEPDQQRARIVQAQDEFLGKLGKRLDDERVTRFQTVPYLAMELTQEDLEELAALRTDREGWVLLDGADGLGVQLEPEFLLGPSQGTACYEWGETLEAASARVRGNTSADGDGWILVFIDTGVDPAFEPFFEGQVIGGGAFTSTEGEYAMASPAGSPVVEGVAHGTTVATVAAGELGVAPKVSIVSLRVTGKGGIAREADVVKALENVYYFWRDGTRKIAAVCIALNETIDISKKSIGGYSCRRKCSYIGSALLPVINNLDLAGIPVVVSAGNDGYDDRVTFPACIGPVFTVGASETNFPEEGYRVLSSSNWGCLVDATAPGGRICLVEKSVTGMGTSLSAGLTAGAIALLRDAMPGRSHHDILLALKESGPLREHAGYACRDINVESALEWLKANP